MATRRSAVRTRSRQHFARALNRRARSVSPAVVQHPETAINTVSPDLGVDVQAAYSSISATGDTRSRRVVEMGAWPRTEAIAPGAWLVDCAGALRHDLPTGNPTWRHNLAHLGVAVRSMSLQWRYIAAPSLDQNTRIRTCSLRCGASFAEFQRPSCRTELFDVLGDSGRSTRRFTMLRARPMPRQGSADDG
jgi:hypothetical protein